MESLTRTPRRWTGGRPRVSTGPARLPGPAHRPVSGAARPPARGALAWSVRFAPPPGKFIKIVAWRAPDAAHLDPCRSAAAQDGRGPSARPLVDGLNPTGKPAQRRQSVRTVALVIYQGEPDELPP